MNVSRVRLLNFKSFRDLDVNLGGFSVLVGANASGKSNFVQAFRFLHDIVMFGLDNAVSLQGGIQYLRNVSLGSSENMTFEVTFEHGVGAWEPFALMRMITERKGLRFRSRQTVYRFVMAFDPQGLGFHIEEDRLTQRFDILKGESRRKVGEGEIVFASIDGEVTAESDLPDRLNIDIEDMYPPFLREEKLKPHTLLLDASSSYPLLYTGMLLMRALGGIRIYDFDPRLSKRAVQVTGKAELEEDGNNLAIVLEKIIDSDDNKRRLFNLVRDLLPFVDDLDVERYADKSLLFRFREVYSGQQYLPASFLSDGTINVTALVLALYFADRHLVIIEEPERNIHPHLISRVVDMLREAASQKQIIVTTHNPEVVRHAGLQNILLVSRGKDGFSTISRPGEKEEVRVFLKNDLGIEDLYIQDLLGV